MKDDSYANDKEFASVAVQPVDGSERDASQTLPQDHEPGTLGHMPRQKFSVGRLVKSLGSRDAWLGDYVSGCGLPRASTHPAHLAKQADADGSTMPPSSSPTCPALSGVSCPSTASTTACHTSSS